MSVTSKSRQAAFIQSFPDLGKAMKNLNHPTHMFPAEVKGDDLPFHLNFRTVNMWSFTIHLVSRFSHIFIFLLVISLFKMASNYRAEVYLLIRP